MKRHLFLVLCCVLAGNSLAQAPVEEAGGDPDRLQRAQQRASFAEREKRQADQQVQAAEEKLRQAEVQHQEAQKKADEAKRDAETARKELEQAKARAKAGGEKWQKESKALEREWPLREKSRSGGKGQ